MRIPCNACGKSVSSEVPGTTIMRAWIECPECLKKEKDENKRVYTKHIIFICCLFCLYVILILYSVQIKDLINYQKISNCDITLPGKSGVYCLGWDKKGNKYYYQKFYIN